MGSRTTQKKSDAERRDNAAAGSRPVRPSAQEAQPRGGARKWLFRAAALVLGPFLVWGLLEGGLRLGGYGYSTDFFQHVMIAGTECLVPNPDFGKRFFPAALARVAAPTSMKAVKSAGTFRIFIFGESAAQGDPRPQFGASRFLEALLREGFPGQKFEVVNTSMTAINSHVILPIARECAQYDGDAWIVYMGNNEMVGPFGAATVFGRKAAPLPLVRFSLAIQRWRTGQLLMSLAGRLRRGSSEPSRWGGMQMFTQNEVAPTDPSRERVYENFRRNLEDIVGTAPGRGAKLILSTMAVNLKDCPPFSSLPPASLGGSQEAFKAACDAGKAAVEQRQFPEAVKQWQKAAELSPESATAQFGLAEALLGMTNVAEARRHYERARDCDTLPFRTDSKLNSLIAKEAERSGAQVCDAASIFATNSPAGVPGHEVFYEHVHFNPDGNYRLALAWAQQLEKVLPRHPGSWTTQQRCEHLLGLTDWNRVSILEEVIERMQQPPLSAQPNNTARTAALQAEVSALRERMRSTPTAQVKAAYEDAVRLAPNDYMVREAYAEFLQATGDRDGEVEQRQRIAALTPRHYFSFLNLGLALREQKRFPEAEAALGRAVALNPIQPEVRLQLGAVYGLENRHEAAVEEFQKARRLAPYDPRPLQFTAESLWKLNRRPESIAMLREAVRLQPSYVDARYRLGEELALNGELQEAAAEMQEVLKLKPNHEKARFNLGVALAKMGQLDKALEQFDEVLRVDPQNKLALQMRAQVLSDRNRR